MTSFGRLPSGTPQPFRMDRRAGGAEGLAFFSAREFEAVVV
jgi:hypothetical protein